MSQENVEQVRRAFTAYAESGIEALLPFAYEDVIIHSIPDWPNDPEYYGHDGLRKLDRQWNESFDDYRLDVRELHDTGDTVIALLEQSGRTKDASVPLSWPIAMAFSNIADGRVREIQLYPSWDDALEAAGLSE